MPLSESPDQQPRLNPFAGVDVLSVLRENRWLLDVPSTALTEWAEQSASLLGHFAIDRAALLTMLRLIFEYDASQIMQLTDSHAVLARHGARDVIRHLALHLLHAEPLTSD